MRSGCDDLDLVRVELGAGDGLGGSFKRGRNVVFGQDVIGYMRRSQFVLQR